VRRGWTADMREVYAHTRLVFVGTQTCETFCRVAAEARACGIPLLVSDAGNLVNMAAGGHGIVIGRHAPIEDWQAGLEAALQLRPEPDAGECRDDSHIWLRECHAARNLREALFIQPNAPGVAMACYQARRVLGITLADWPATPEAMSSAAISVIGGHFPREFAEKCGRPLAFWWCSHCAQMDTSRHEVTDLLAAARHVSERSDRWMLFTYRDDAEAWASRLGDRSRWLPCPLRVEPLPPVPKREGRHVFIPGPYGARKNPYTAIAACALAGAEAHVTKRADAAESLAGLAAALGVRLHVHDCPDAAAVHALAGSCQAALY